MPGMPASAQQLPSTSSSAESKCHRWYHDALVLFFHLLIISNIDTNTCNPTFPVGHGALSENKSQHIPTEQRMLGNSGDQKTSLLYRTVKDESLFFCHSLKIYIEAAHQ